MRHWRLLWTKSCTTSARISSALRSAATNPPACRICAPNRTMRRYRRRSDVPARPVSLGDLDTRYHQCCGERLGIVGGHEGLHRLARVHDEGELLGGPSRVEVRPVAGVARAPDATLAPKGRERHPGDGADGAER